MNKNIPIGCRTWHFPKKVGKKKWECMYCKKQVFIWDLLNPDNTTRQFRTE